jgi:hypothetical protein
LPRSKTLKADSGLPRNMNRQAAQLLKDFEALPEEEKSAFTVEFLRRAAPFDSGPLDDSEIAAADRLLASLE